MIATTKNHIECLVERHFDQMLEELNIDDEDTNDRHFPTIEVVQEYIVDLYEQVHGPEC